MSEYREVTQDERTVAVENASFRWGINFLSFALFLDIMYRWWFRHEKAWDLFGMLMVSGWIITYYKVRERTLVWPWRSKLFIIVVVTAFVIAALLGFILKRGL